MLAFVRVFAFYVGTAALLTWGLFALGWADSLEMPGFEGPRSGTPVAFGSPSGAAQIPEPAQVPVPKSALPREARAPVIETPPMPPSVPVSPVVVAPPPRAPVAEPATKVAAIPQPDRALPAPATRAPEPVVVPAPPAPAAAPPPSPPAPEGRAKEPRPAPVVAPQPGPPAAPPPPRQVDVAPAPRPPAAAPPPPAPPRPTAEPQRSPSRWVAVRRVAGFGHDALIDQMEETRRSVDDVPCIVLRELAFRPGTATFDQRTRGELQTVAKVLTLFPNQRVEIGSKLGPGRPMASDVRLRMARVREVRDGLVGLGIAPERLLVEHDGSYERVADDVARVGFARVQSIGMCVQP